MSYLKILDKLYSQMLWIANCKELIWSRYTFNGFWRIKIENVPRTLILASAIYMMLCHWSTLYTEIIYIASIQMSLM